MSHTTYRFGIVGLRWLVSPRSDAEPQLQYALCPLNEAGMHWFNVPTEVAEPATPPDAQQEASHG